MNKTLVECYEVLGVGLEATPEEIKKAYKSQALACHPDKNRDDPDAVKKFQELGYAYKKITSDDKDEEEDDWEDMFSDFDYWLEFFIYCMYEEGLMFDDINCQHCCCAHCDSDDDDDEEEEDDDEEYCCRKHRQKRKEENFTKEEMERFVKFNSLKEQREFNKKIFCNSKKTTKEKKEHQIQKPKGKSNKQLKAEEWKRQKEISKIAEEIEMKRKQQEEKLEQSKELSNKKNKKIENVERIQDAVKVPHNKQTSSSEHKVRSKKKKKRGRAKNENKVHVIADNSTKIYQQPAMPQAPAVKKVTETKINHTKKTNLPLPAMKPNHTRIPGTQARLVAKPVSIPSPVIPTPQPPNIWQKRMETQNEIQQILPTSEEEELRQLQMALEMSRNLAEMEEQQKQIAALQEELKLISLEQENLKLCLSDTDEEAQELDKVPLDVRTGISLTSSTTHSGSVAFGDKDKNQEHSPVEVENNSLPQSNPNIEGIMTSSCHDQPTYVQHSKYEQFRPKTCLNQWEEKNVCPYGRNCCLGKRCTKFHPSSKRSEPCEANKDPCIVRMKSVITCSDLESKLLDETKDCDHDNTITASTVTSSEDWDDEVAAEPNSDIIKDKRYIPDHAIHPSTMPYVINDHPSEEDWRHDEEMFDSQDSDDTCSESESEDKAPLSSVTFNMTEKSQENENWDNELKECGVAYGDLPLSNVMTNGHGIQSYDADAALYHGGFKTETNRGSIPTELPVANGNHLPGPTNVSQGVSQMSPGMPQNYMPSYPIKGNLHMVHPAMNSSLNGGIRPVQPLLPMLGLDMLSGLTNPCQFNQSNVILNPVKNGTSSPVQFPPGQMVTGPFTSQNPVVPSSSLFSTSVPMQGSFHAGNITCGNLVSPIIPVSSQVLMPERVQSKTQNHDTSRTNISSELPRYTPTSQSESENKTCTDINMGQPPSSFGETTNDVIMKQTSHQVKTVIPGSITEHGNGPGNGSHHWSNVCPASSPSTVTQPALPIPGLSMPTLQTMNPLLPMFPGLPLPQHGVMSNRFTTPKTVNSPGIHNPPFVGFQCGAVPLANNMNLVSLMALEAQYLNMLQTSSSLSANQPTNPCEPINNRPSTQVPGEQSTSIPSVEKQTVNNNGSNIRKPVTVPRVLSYVESR